MSELKLSPGPVLTQRRYPNPQPVDVTARAVAFLFDTVEVDPAVTLGDVLRLLELSPELQQVYQRDYATEMLAEAVKGPLVDQGPYQDQIEYLELYQLWSFNTATRTYQPQHRLDLTGVGVELKEPLPDHGLEAGGRIRWGVSTAGLRKLLNTPIRLNQEVIVCEDDLDAKDYGRELSRVNVEGVSLGQVIHGLLWELSFYGSPVEQEEFTESLKEQMTELEAGTMETVEHFDIFEDMERPGIVLMFETIGNLKAREVSYALRSIGNEDNVAQALAEAYGMAVVVKEEYRHLGGRAFRKTFREAGHS